MAFDWLTFLDQHNIEYEPGRRGWINTWCPYCGGPGTHHIGINTDLGIYNCWHGSTHKGRSPIRLVSALLNCSFDEARRIVGSSETSFVQSDDNFADDTFQRLGMIVQPQSPRPGKLEFLPEFIPVRDAGICRPLVMPYLKERGYNRDDAVRLASRYKLRFAPNGVFSYRIIIPVFVDKQLVTWTGRSIAKSEQLRYKSLSTDYEKAKAQGLPAATKNIKDTLLDYDNLVRGGEILVLTEGPFDCFKINRLGENYGIRATCLFGKMPTPAQLDLLAGLTSRYDEVVGLFDRDVGVDFFLTMPEYLNIKPMKLPDGVKDPAELDEPQFMKLFFTGPTMNDLKGLYI